MSVIIYFFSVIPLLSHLVVIYIVWLKSHTIIINSNKPNTISHPIITSAQSSNSPLMKRTSHNKERENSISILEKVKRKFRYSPSFEAQKRNNKLSFRYNYGSSNVSHANQPRNDHMKSNQINCQYSSVKQQNMETNECNDTSSWIAKLVNGIQDQDEDNKNFQKLSQIGNRSVSDLPEDSQEDEYNQFLMQKNSQIQKGIQIKGNIEVKNIQLITHKQDKEKLLKKPIKESLLDLQNELSRQGLKGPPATRANSFSKRQNDSKTPSKKNSIKNIQEKQQQEKGNIKKQRKTNTKSTTVARRGTTRKQFLEANADKVTKSLCKLAQKSTQVESLQTSFANKSQKAVQKKHTMFKQKTNHQIEQEHHLRLIGEGTKKQSMNKIKLENEELSTRKNSYFQKEELSQCKQQYQIVKQHSMNLNVKNLFSQQNQESIVYSNNKDNEVESSSTKRVGVIKKNKKNDNPINVQLFTNTNQYQIDKKIQHGGEQVGEIALKFNYLRSKRQPSQITLHQPRTDRRIIIDLQDEIISSFRTRNITYKQLPNDQCNTSKQQLQNIITQSKTESNLKQRNSARVQYADNKSNLLQLKTAERIYNLFRKIKLDPSKQKVSRNNLKLRGLSNEEKAQLGSIITKIHYQNIEYDLQTFERQFISLNSACAQSGCFSQQKISKGDQLQILNRKREQIDDVKEKVNSYIYSNDHGKVSREQQRNADRQNLMPNHFEDSNQQSTIEFSQNEPLDIAQKINSQIWVGHRRRNSKVIKQQLFEQIKKISHLQQQAIEQLQRNSKISQVKEGYQKDNLKQLKQIGLGTSQLFEENICKDPYIADTSLTQIQLTNRLRETFRRDQNRNCSLQRKSPNFGQNNFEVKQIPNESISNQENSLKNGSFGSSQSSHIIQKLNTKLSNYINKNHLESTYKQFNLNFSQLKKHMR